MWLSLAQDNVITEERSAEEHGVSASVVGAVNHTRPHKLRNSYRNHYESKGLPAKRHSTQFKVSPSGQLPMGTSNLIFFVFFACTHTNTAGDSTPGSRSASAASRSVVQLHYDAITARC